jgi:hypothetical protein
VLALRVLQARVDVLITPIVLTPDAKKTVWFRKHMLTGFVDEMSVLPVAVDTLPKGSET